MSPNEQELIGLLAYFYLQNSRPDKAMTLYSVLDVMSPGDPLIIGSLACAQIRADHPERAIETLDRLAMAGGDEVLYFLMRTQALSAMGRDIEARSAMQSYLKARKAAFRPLEGMPRKSRAG